MVRGRSSFTTASVLLAAAGEGVDNDGQQHNQQLAHGRRLARQVTLARVLRAVPVVCEATGRATEARLIAFLDSVPSPVIGARRSHSTCYPIRRWLPTRFP